MTCAMPRSSSPCWARPEQTKDAFAALRHAEPFLRKSLSPRLQLRYLPEIHFLPDESIKTGARVDELIQQLRPGKESLDAANRQARQQTPARLPVSASEPPLPMTPEPDRRRAAPPPARAAAQKRMIIRPRPGGMEPPPGGVSQGERRAGPALSPADGDGALHLPLILRAEDGGRHSGQVSFPGGAQEGAREPQPDRAARGPGGGGRDPPSPSPSWAP